MGSHGPTCACPFCVTWGRIHFFVTHPSRDRRILDVGVVRLRVLYSQLVDLAEGFAAAPELLGQPFIPDPGLPPRAGLGNTEGGVPLAPPVATGTGEELKTTAAKFKAAPPVQKEEKAHLDQLEKEEAPGEKKSPAKRGERPSTSRPRGSASKPAHRQPETTEDPEPKDKRSRRERRRSSSSKTRDRKRSRRTRSPSRRRSRSRRRRKDKESESPERRRERKAAAFVEVKEELDPSAERAAPVEPAGRAETARGSRDEGRRRPRSPSRPPPPRSHWVGPIRAPDRRGPEPREEGQHWPKSKGVKRREKNRAFREANYGRGWNHRGGESHRR